MYHYYYGRKWKYERVQKRFLQSVPFGGGCINDTIIHLATSYMGFGGVGYSGYGSYHGKRSFSLFSHEKSIVKKYNYIDLPIRYQPYSKKKEKLIKYTLYNKYLIARAFHGLERSFCITKTPR